MSINLQPELEAWVRQEASREGVTPEEIVARAIKAQWATAPANPPASGVTESELFTIINDGFPEAFWHRYRLLHDRLEAETLTEPERQELLQRNDELETKNVRRIEALLKLARLRGTTLPALMQELGITSLQAP